MLTNHRLPHQLSWSNFKNKFAFGILRLVVTEAKRSRSPIRTGSIGLVQKSLFCLDTWVYVSSWPLKWGQGHQNLLSFLSCPNNMYMPFWQESVDNVMRNRAYMKVSQILSHRVIVQNNICLLPLSAEVNYCCEHTGEKPRTPMSTMRDTNVPLIWFWLTN